MDLQADASGKVNGTVTEIGNPPVLNIESGTISGKTVTWVTQPRGVTWNLEMADDNTLTLVSRTFAGRGGAGGGGARAAIATSPGGAIATAPGGATPPATLPPADGAAAGGPPPAGAGRGRGVGRGPQQPIVLHRVK
jgi:hypothetical protein